MDSNQIVKNDGNLISISKISEKNENLLELINGTGIKANSIRIVNKGENTLFLTINDEKVASDILAGETKSLSYIDEGIILNKLLTLNEGVLFEINILTNNSLN